MGKAISMVASVFLSFLPRVGLILKPLGLHRTVIIFSVFSGVTDRWKFAFMVTRDAPRGWPQLKRFEIKLSLIRKAENVNMFK
jgi:hypothetical protein